MTEKPHSSLLKLCCLGQGPTLDSQEGQNCRDGANMNHTVDLFTIGFAPLLSLRGKRGEGGSQGERRD